MQSAMSISRGVPFCTAYTYLLQTNRDGNRDNDTLHVSFDPPWSILWVAVDRPCEASSRIILEKLTEVNRESVHSICCQHSLI
jgi:hypothetical protein